MGACDWIGEMGSISRGMPLGCNTGWMWAMGLSMGACYGGRATGSGRWNWFVGERHGGARHWLDPGDGIDLCGHAIGACDTGWIGAMELIHGGLARWQSTIWLMNLNDDIMCPHVWRWGKCAECVWLKVLWTPNLPYRIPATVLQILPLVANLWGCRWDKFVCLFFIFVCCLCYLFSLSAYAWCLSWLSIVLK